MDATRGVYFGNENIGDARLQFAKKVAQEEGVSEEQVLKETKVIDNFAYNDATDLAWDIASACRGHVMNKSLPMVMGQIEKVIEENLGLSPEQAENTNWIVRKAETPDGKIVSLGMNKFNFLSHQEREGVSVYIQPMDGKALIWSPDKMGLPFRNRFAAPAAVRYGFFVLDPCTSDEVIPYFD